MTSPVATILTKFARPHRRYARCRARSSALNLGSDRVPYIWVTASESYTNHRPLRRGG